MRATLSKTCSSPSRSFTEIKYPPKRKDVNRRLFFSVPKFKLFLHVRKQSHESCALDCGLDGALLLGGEPPSLAADHAAVRIDELLQEINVFVVDVLDIILSENIRHIFAIYF